MVEATSLTTHPKWDAPPAFWDLGWWKSFRRGASLGGKMWENGKMSFSNKFYESLFFWYAIFCSWNLKLTRKTQGIVSQNDIFSPKRRSFNMPSERRSIWAWKIRRMEPEAMISRKKVHLPKSRNLFDHIRSFFCGLYPKLLYGSNQLPFWNHPLFDIATKFQGRVVTEIERTNPSTI